MNKQIAIIGAGPAGLIAAEKLVAAGAQVTVYDRMPTAGRKFLMAGRGGLNLTHAQKLEDFLGCYESQSAWIKPFIKRFPPKDLIAWADALEAKTFVGSSGRVFPKAMKASPLLRAWLSRLNDSGVEFNLRHDWIGWQDDKLLFTENENEVVVETDATILALGGASWPNLGADGSWVPLLLNKGVRIIELEPSNMGWQLSWSERFQAEAGQALKSVRLTVDGVSRVGELMITEDGLEGGLAYTFSQPIRQMIQSQGFADVKLDLCPQWTRAQAEIRLEKQNAKQSLSNKLRKGLSLSGPKLALFNEIRAQGFLEDQEADSIARLVKSMPLQVDDFKGLKRAISSAGGISQGAVDQNLMLKNAPGIFACGEMLDWEAPTGGYLLQGCFSTGVAAAKAVETYLNTATV